MSCDCSSATPGPLLTLPPRTNGRFRITLFDCVTEERLDLSATPFEWVVQPAADNATVLLTKTLGAGLAPANLGLGEVDILVVPADSDKIPLYQTVTWFFRVTLPEGIYIPRGGSGSICLALNPASTCATVTLPADAPCATVAVVPLNPPSPIYATIVYVDDEIAIEAAARIAGDAATVATAAADATAKANAAQAAAIAASIPLAQKGAPSGVATLDAGGKLPTAQLPDLAVSKYLGSVASQVAMLALVGQEGDWCTRSDLGTNFIITGADPTQLASWTQLNYPTAPVTSVAGKAGAVALEVADVAGAAPLASPVLTGTPTAPTQTAGERSTKLATTAFVGTEAHAIVDPIANSRSARQALVLNGTTGAVILNGSAVGLGDFTFSVPFSAGVTSSLSILIGSAPNGALLVFNGTTRVLELWHSGGLSPDNISTATGLDIGQWALGTVNRTAGLVSFYVNDRAAGSSANSYNYTGVLNRLGTLDVAPSLSLTGVICAPLVYNYALTTAQVAALFRDGAAAAVDRGGSMAALNTSAFVNSGVIPYPSFSGASTAGFTATASAGNNRALMGPYNIEAGKEYTFHLTASGAAVAGSVVSFGVENISVDSDVFSPTVGDNTFVLTANKTGATYLTFGTPTAGSLVVSAFSFKRRGTTAQYDLEQLGVGPLWRDVNGTTPRADIILPDDGDTGGVSWLKRTAQPSRWLATITGTSFLLGRDGRHITALGHIREIRAKGNGTFSLGSSGGATTEVVNAQTAGAAWGVVTLASNVSTTGKLYGTLGTATSVELEILSD